MPITSDNRGARSDTTSFHVSPRWLNILIPVIVLLAAAVVAFGRSLHAPFIFDDYNAIVENPYIEKLWPITDAMRAPERSSVTGRPVVCLTLAINYAIAGRKVEGYHVANIALHACSALLLFGILRRTFGKCPLPGMAGAGEGAARWPALLLALIWAVHPLHSETVAYVTQRTVLLASFFYLATLHGAILGWAAERRGTRLVWHAAAVVACALGMGSKEIMVSAPLAVLLYDRAFVNGGFMPALRRGLFLYVGLAATWAILLAIVLNTSRPMAGFGYGGSAIEYLRTQAGVLVHYLRLCAWPHPLAIAYDWPVATWSRSLVPFLIMTALFAATAVGLYRRRALAVAGACFFIILAPTSSFVPIATEFVAERRMYLPLLAVLVVIAAGVSAVLHRKLAPRPARAIGAGLGLVAVAALLVVSVDRVRDYESLLSIWRANHAVFPDGRQSNAGLGFALIEADRFAEAVPYLARAVKLDPDDEPSWSNLGLAYGRSGQYEPAAAAFEEAMRRRGDDPSAHHNFGIVLAQLGRFDEALDHLRTADALRPDYPATTAMIADVLQRKRARDSEGR